MKYKQLYFYWTVKKDSINNITYTYTYYVKRKNNIILSFASFFGLRKWRVCLNRITKTLNKQEGSIFYNRSSASLHVSNEVIFLNEPIPDEYLGLFKTEVLSL